MVMNFEYGLRYEGRLYVWFKKKLYRYPFENKGRYYGLKEIIPKHGKYRLARKWVSMGSVKRLTTIVDVLPVNELPKHSDLPF